MNVIWIIGGITAAALLLIVFISVRQRNVMSKKITYMIDALEDGEVNFKFREDGMFSRSLNRILNRIRDIFDRRRSEMLEHEVLYGKMLDRVSTGIMMVGEDGRVIYSNEASHRILGVYSLINLRQTAKISTELCDALFSAVDDMEQKVSFLSSMAQMTVSIRASVTEMEGRQVRIIALSDISGEKEETEVASWIKLIRVLTHEIMNTVSPISSLSDSLVAYADTASKPELREGLETISSSSKGLIKFVETYRSLTRIPEPVRKAHYLSDIVARAIHLVEPYLTVPVHEATDVTSGGSDAQPVMRNVSCTYTGRQHDIVIYADEDQILQIMVNILRNAIQAGAQNILIHSRMDAGGSIFIDMVNDGAPISEASRDEIFVPFYTTKATGSGIGLSLSRQIMRLHGGNLLLTRSDETATVFTMVFK